MPVLNLLLSNFTEPTQILQLEDFSNPTYDFLGGHSLLTALAFGDTLAKSRVVVKHRAGLCTSTIVQSQTTSLGLQ